MSSLLAKVVVSIAIMAAATSAGCVSDNSVVSGSPPLSPYTCFVVLSGSSLINRRPEDRCGELGGAAVLGSIHSSVENVFVQALAAQALAPSVELGLYATTIPAGYDMAWYDGTDLDYANFDNGFSPNGPGYVTVNTATGRWSTSFTGAAYFLCRIATAAPPGATPQPSPPPTTSAAPTTSTAAPTTTTMAPTTTNASTTTAAPPAILTLPPNTTTAAPNTTTAPSNWTAWLSTNATANTTMPPATNGTFAPFNTTANFTFSFMPNTTTAPQTTLAPRSYSSSDCVTLVAMSPPLRSLVASLFDVMPQSQLISPLHASMVAVLNSTSAALVRSSLQSLRVALTGSYDCSNVRSQMWVPIVCDDTMTCGVPPEVSWSSFAGRTLTLCVAPSRTSLEAARRAISMCNATSVDVSQWNVTSNGTASLPVMLPSKLTFASVPQLVPTSVTVAADVLDNPFRARAASIRTVAADGSSVASLPQITSAVCSGFAAVVTFVAPGGDLSFAAARQVAFSLQTASGSCSDAAQPLTFLNVNGSALTLGIPCGVVQFIAVEPSVTKLCVALPFMSSAPIPTAQLWLSQGPTPVFEVPFLQLFARGSEVATDVVVAFDAPGTLQQPTVNFISCDFADQFAGQSGVDCLSAAATVGLPARQWIPSPVVAYGSEGRASFTLRSEAHLMRPTFPGREACVCFSTSTDSGSPSYAVIASSALKIQVLSPLIFSLVSGPDVGLGTTDPTLVVLPLWYTGNVTVTGGPGVASLLEGQSIVLCAAPTIVVVPRLYALLDDRSLMGYIDPSIFVYLADPTQRILSLSTAARQVPASLCLLPVNRPGYGAATPTSFSLLIRSLAFVADNTVWTDGQISTFTFTAPFGVAANAAPSTQIDAAVPLQSNADEVIALTGEVQSSVLFPNATGFFGAAYTTNACRPQDRLTSFVAMAPPMFAPARVDLFPWDVTALPPLVYWCIAPAAVTGARSAVVKPVRFFSGVSFTVVTTAQAPIVAATTLNAQLSDVVGATYDNITGRLTVDSGAFAALSFASGSSSDRRQWWAVPPSSATALESMPLTMLSDGTRVLVFPQRTTALLSGNTTYTIQAYLGAPAGNAFAVIVSPSGMTQNMAPSALRCAMLASLLPGISPSTSATPQVFINSTTLVTASSFASTVDNFRGCSYRLSVSSDGSCTADATLDVGPSNVAVVSTYGLPSGAAYLSVCSVMPTTGTWAPLAGIGLNMTLPAPVALRRVNGPFVPSVAAGGGYASAPGGSDTSGRYLIDTVIPISGAVLYGTSSSSSCDAAAFAGATFITAPVDAYNSVVIPSPAFDDPAPLLCIAASAAVSPGSIAIAAPLVILSASNGRPDLRSRLAIVTHVLRVTAGGNGQVVVPLSVPLPDLASIAIVHPSITCASLASASAAQARGFAVGRVLNNRFSFTVGVAPSAVAVTPNVSRSQLCVSVADAAMHVVPLEIFVATVDTTMPVVVTSMTASKTDRDVLIPISPTIWSMAPVAHALLVPIDGDTTRAPCDATRAGGVLASHRPRALTSPAAALASTTTLVLAVHVDGGALTPFSSYRVCLAFSDGHDPTDPGPVVSGSATITFIDGVLYDTAVVFAVTPTPDWSVVTDVVSSGFVTEDAAVPLLEVQLSSPAPVGLVIRNQTGVSGDLSVASGASMGRFVKTGNVPAFTLPACVVSSPYLVACTLSGFLPSAATTAAVAVSWNGRWIVVDGLQSRVTVITPEKAALAFYNPDFAPASAWTHAHLLELGVAATSMATVAAPMLCLGCISTGGITVTHAAASIRMGAIPVGTVLPWTRTRDGISNVIDTVDTRVVMRLSSTAVGVGLPRPYAISVVPPPPVSYATLGATGIAVTIVSAGSSTSGDDAVAIVNSILDAVPSAAAFIGTSTITWWGATQDGWTTPLLANPANWQPSADGTPTVAAPMLLGIAVNGSDPTSCVAIATLTSPATTTWSRAVPYFGAAALLGSLDSLPRGPLCTTFVNSTTGWTLVAGPSGLAGGVTLIQKSPAVNAINFVPTLDVSPSAVFNTTSGAPVTLVLTDVAGPVTQIALFATSSTSGAALTCDPTSTNFVGYAAVRVGLGVAAFPTATLPPTWLAVPAQTTNTLVCVSMSNVLGVASAVSWSPAQVALTFGAPRPETTLDITDVAVGLWYAPTYTADNATAAALNTVCSTVLSSIDGTVCRTKVFVRSMLGVPNAVTVYISRAVFPQQSTESATSLVASVTLYNMVAVSNALVDVTAAVGFWVANGTIVTGMPMQAAGTGSPATTAPTKAPGPSPNGGGGGLKYFLAFLCIVVPGTVFVIFRAWSEKNRSAAEPKPAAPRGTIETGAATTAPSVTKRLSSSNVASLRTSPRAAASPGAPSGAEGSPALRKLPAASASESAAAAASPRKDAGAPAPQVVPMTEVTVAERVPSPVADAAATTAAAIHHPKAAAEGPLSPSPPPRRPDEDPHVALAAAPAAIAVASITPPALPPPQAEASPAAPADDDPLYDADE